MLLQLLKCKLHHAHVVSCDVNYVGSIAIDSDLMDAVGLFEGELVHLWAVDHKSRIQTYVIRSHEKGMISVRGGAALFFQPGDRIIIAAFALSEKPIEPKVAVLDELNQITKLIHET